MKAGGGDEKKEKKSATVFSFLFFSLFFPFAWKVIEETRKRGRRAEGGVWRKMRKLNLFEGRWRGVVREGKIRKEKEGDVGR